MAGVCQKKLVIAVARDFRHGEEGADGGSFVGVKSLANFRG